MLSLWIKKYNSYQDGYFINFKGYNSIVCLNNKIMWTEQQNKYVTKLWKKKTLLALGQ